MKTISFVTGCFNEEENIRETYTQITEMVNRFPAYQYEIIIIDNASQDNTESILREIAQTDPHVKVILNARNFGHIRSPYHAMLQAKGDAAIFLASDLQDPPSLIPEFIRKWEEGFKIVIGAYRQSGDTFLFSWVRKAYYHLVGRFSEIEMIKNYTGFGLYDRRVLDVMHQVSTPYPYFRGLICEIGFPRAVIEFDRPPRQRGFSKNNFYTLYDMAMLGFTNHSKVPLRLAAMAGFVFALLSFLVATVYFFYKLLFWSSFSLGMAPVVIGLFFFFSVQLFFIGIIGEYIGAIHTQVMNRPLVVEKERINFDTGK